MAQDWRQEQERLRQNNEASQETLAETERQACLKRKEAISSATVCRAERVTCDCLDRRRAGSIQCVDAHQRRETPQRRSTEEEPKLRTQVGGLKMLVLVVITNQILLPVAPPPESLSVRDRGRRDIDS
jgi:hypothetical protein